MPVARAASVIGLSHTSLRDGIARGLYPIYKHGRATYVDCDEVRNIMREQK
jgi:hypothetical protein